MTLFHKHVFTLGLNHHKYVLKMLDFLKLLRDILCIACKYYYKAAVQRDTLFSVLAKVNIVKLF